MIVRIEHDDDGDYEVWLEPELGDRYVGLCCGSGSTKAKALEQALIELVVIVEKTRMELREA